MRLWSRIAVLAALVPLVASAQFGDLDTAVQNLTRGFGSGDPQAVVAGVAAGDKVMLQFPGLVTENGFYGRDQAAYLLDGLFGKVHPTASDRALLFESGRMHFAAYLLDGLFGKVHPTAFEQQSARKFSAEGQYQITAIWTIQVAGKAESRELYITLKKQGEKWAVTSVRSGGK